MKCIKELERNEKWIKQYRINDIVVFVRVSILVTRPCMNYSEVRRRKLSSFKSSKLFFALSLKKFPFSTDAVFFLHNFILFFSLFLFQDSDNGSSGVGDLFAARKRKYKNQSGTKNIEVKIEGSSDLN